VLKANTWKILRACGIVQEIVDFVTKCSVSNFLDYIFNISMLSSIFKCLSVRFYICSTVLFSTLFTYFICFFARLTMPLKGTKKKKYNKKYYVQNKDKISEQKLAYNDEL